MLEREQDHRFARLLGQFAALTALQLQTGTGAGSKAHRA